MHWVWFDTKKNTWYISGTLYRRLGGVSNAFEYRVTTGIIVLSIRDPKRLFLVRRFHAALVDGAGLASNMAFKASRPDYNSAKVRPILL